MITKKEKPIPSDIVLCHPEQSEDLRTIAAPAVAALTYHGLISVPPPGQRYYELIV